MNQAGYQGMYDYLVKIILLGPSGSGKSCLLHRFVKNEWPLLSSQTIGVEFASKIVEVGSGNRKKRIKLQLWDTAGTERFQAISRSYYRGATGALLVYDITSRESFESLSSFLHQVRALASPRLSLLLVGNKTDLDGLPPSSSASSLYDASSSYYHSPSSVVSSTSTITPSTQRESDPTFIPSSSASFSYLLGSQYPQARLQHHHDGLASTSPSASSQYTVSIPPQRETQAPDGRMVSLDDASEWARQMGIPVVMETSAYRGDGVDEVFRKLASVILTKIELGELDPDDSANGIQYGDGYDDRFVSWGANGANHNNYINSSSSGGGDAFSRRNADGTSTHGGSVAGTIVEDATSPGSEGLRWRRRSRTASRPPLWNPDGAAVEGWDISAPTRPPRRGGCC